MVSYTSVIAQAHTPPYKIHRYFARRPWNVFKQLVEIYSKKGDIVLDPFCGGGVTIYEGIRLGRKVVGFDLNPLSIFIVKNMIKKGVNLIELDSAYSKIINYLKYLYADYNLVDFKSVQKTLVREGIEVEWNELAFYALCNFCGVKVLLSNDNRVANGKYSCPNANCRGSKAKDGFVMSKDCKRDGYEYLYSVACSPINKKMVVVKYDSARTEKVKKHIDFLQREAKENNVKVSKDEIPLNWDRQNEDLLLRKGIKTFQDFFTKRNLLINTLLLNFISKLDVSKDRYEILRMVFSSSLRDTNIMSFTNTGWQSGKPTTWSKHAYWVPSHFCEVNVLSSFRKAFNRVRTAIVFNEQFNYRIITASNFSDLHRRSNILLTNSSIDDSDIPNNSVDTIITDPPYGSNVQYLELSHFWYIWNRDLYENKEPNFLKEAVSNRKKNFVGAKSMKDYEDNLFKVFNKSYQVLKPNGHMVLTFNNKNIGAWMALLISIFRSGFVLKKNGLYFQDGVDNYKQTAHTKYEGAPYGDFIYVFKKDSKSKAKLSKNISEDKFIKDLDTVFNHYLHDFKEFKGDRNNIIRRMFLDALPKIELFVKSNLLEGSKHNLYAHFNKNYLRRIYR